ncbi:MAG: amidase, partial [Chitinophagaceae bacterium]|nr:amidase [Polaromonas sp.]
MPSGLFAANTLPETPPESTQASTQTSRPAPLPNAGIPLAGLPISVKDLFDVAGQITAAGSTVLA